LLGRGDLDDHDAGIPPTESGKAQGAVVEVKVEPDIEVLHIIRDSYKGIRRCKVVDPNPDQTRLEGVRYMTQRCISVFAPSIVPIVAGKYLADRPVQN
jgi:hypothetical protein